MNNRSVVVDDLKSSKRQYSPILPLQEQIRIERSYRTKRRYRSLEILKLRLKRLRRTKAFASQNSQIINKRLATLIPAIVFSLLIIKFLLPLLPFANNTTSTLKSTKYSPRRIAVLPYRITLPTPTPIVALRLAILGQESRGNFQAINPHSGALGAAQVMSANLEDWSRSALGYHITPEEFLQSPELQLKVIDHKLQEYWQEALEDSSGNEAIAVRRVAAYWYSGNPDLYTSTRKQIYDGHEYPSIAEYSHSILEKYKRYRGDSLSISFKY